MCVLPTAAVRASTLPSDLWVPFCCAGLLALMVSSPAAASSAPPSLISLPASSSASLSSKEPMIPSLPAFFKLACHSSSVSSAEGLLMGPCSRILTCPDAIGHCKQGSHLPWFQTHSMSPSLSTLILKRPAMMPYCCAAALEDKLAAHLELADALRGDLVLVELQLGHVLLLHDSLHCCQGALLRQLQHPCCQARQMGSTCRTACIQKPPAAPVSADSDTAARECTLNQLSRQEHVCLAGWLSQCH